MSKKRGKNRLAIQFAAAAFLCALVSMLLFAGMQKGSYWAIEQYITREDVINKKEKACVGRLQEYITEHQLAIGQVKALEEWSDGEKYVQLFLYYQGKLLYTNTGLVVSNENQESDELFYLDTEFPWAYEVKFADGIANVELFYYFETYYYMAAIGISAVLAMGTFVILLFFCVQVKMRYISLLEQELLILKGGDLDYSVTIKGKDELAILASGIEDMRCAIKGRMEKEEEARRANRELVTAMSHDLRTPLTSLLGYVDILNMDDITEQQKKRYLGVIRQKAYQIKEMSDKLFEYFIVYGTEEESLETETVDGLSFVNQVVEDSLFDLESEGFEVQRSSDEIHGSLLVDVKLVRRVFGNVFSNLMKYGDRSYPVAVVYEQKEQYLKIRIANTINRETPAYESSKIGMKTCRKIMEAHGGAFHSGVEGDLFCVEIMFQIAGSHIMPDEQQ